MSSPSRTDPEVNPDWNQDPNTLTGNFTTRNDLNRIANARRHRDHRLDDNGATNRAEMSKVQRPVEDQNRSSPNGPGAAVRLGERESPEQVPSEMMGTTGTPSNGPGANVPLWVHWPRRLSFIIVKYAKFIGPGFMIAVAYIDPGNYATDVAAGATYRFRLLFMVLLSNLFAIFLQSLCIKLGSITGLNLAEMCKAHLPSWLNYFLYIFAEAAIIATDIAEVMGTAIALNLLLNIPLVAGCAISIVDVLFILIFYRPSGSMRGLRAFEFCVMLLVLGVVICFCFQLSLITGVATGEVFQGYLPSSALVESTGWVEHEYSTIEVLTDDLLKSLSSLRHPRRHGHAPLPVSRLWHHPTPPAPV